MNYLSRFKNYLVTDKDAASSTISSYISDLNKFFASDCIPEDVVHITKEHVRNYLSSLTDDGKARSTINRATISIKSFFSFLVEIDIITKTPTESIKTAKKGSSLPKFLPEFEVKAIINAAANHSIKSQLIVELLYGSGGRVSEIANLTVDDIDFKESYIHILGKGRKERDNPIHANCVLLAARHLEKEGITSGYLFPHALTPGKHMDRRSILKLVKTLAAKAGLDPAKVSPHVFRHSYATHLMDNGSDMAHVQQLLGHESIETTQIYAQITKKRKRENFTQYHPLAQSQE